MKRLLQNAVPQYIVDLWEYLIYILRESAVLRQSLRLGGAFMAESYVIKRRNLCALIKNGQFK